MGKEAHVSFIHSFLKNRTQKNRIKTLGGVLLWFVFCAVHYGLFLHHRAVMFYSLFMSLKLSVSF